MNMVNTDVIYGIIAIVVPLVELLGILTAVHAVMNARTSQGAIAWAISLVTFPWLALILYAIFGRNKFKGYVLLRSSKNLDIQHYIDNIRAEAAAKNLIRQDLSESQIALTRLADMTITRCNKSRLLIDGHETFRSIFEGIESAEQYILVQFFIIKDDTVGRELQSKLIQKAKENVKVYFLYDEIGSHKLPQIYLRDMQVAGIVTSAFHTTKGKTNRFQLNFRNHRKIVVVDGNIAYVGGHNVGDEYLGKHPKFGPWRDTHVKMRGPVVQAIQFCFVEDWYWATKGIPELNWELHRAAEGNGDALMIASGRRSIGNLRPDVCAGNQSGPGTDLDRQSLFCSRPPDPQRPETGSLERGGRAHPAAGKSGPSHGVPGVICLLPEYAAFGN